MKSNLLISLVSIIAIGCGFLEDDFKGKRPDPIITTVRYPGILDIKLVSTSDSIDVGNVSNLLIIQNLGTDTLTAVDLIIDGFSNDVHTYEKRIRTDRYKATVSLPPGQSASITLQQTEDYSKNKSNIEISLVSASTSGGIPNHSLSGRYQGFFITYKDSTAIAGGVLLTTIDILGNFKSQLQSPNEFNLADGTISPDSLIFSTLRKDVTFIRKFQSNVDTTFDGNLLINFSIQNDAADSTIITIQKSN